MQAVVDDVSGTDAVVRVTTAANGVAPVKGSISLVASGVRGQVRRVHALSPYGIFSPLLLHHLTPKGSALYDGTCRLLLHRPPSVPANKQELQHQTD